MKESIEIHNFGGIKKLKLEIKPINILIGPQASGKSVSIKLIYFFKSFFEEVRQGHIQKFTAAKIIKKQEEKFIKFFPKSAWPTGDFSMRYFYDKIVFSITRKNDGVQFNCGGKRDACPCGINGYL